LPIDESEKAMLKHGCSLKLNGGKYDVLAFDENFLLWPGNTQMPTKLPYHKFATHFMDVELHDTNVMRGLSLAQIQHIQIISNLTVCVDGPMNPNGNVENL
jgi:hypothetical protein